MSEPEKKIIVDEDWKSKVEAEREQSRAPQAESKSAEGPGDEADQGGPLPPPDLMFVFSTFYMQALVAMGLVRHPIKEKVDVDLPQARHAIDVLDVLEQKTKGNRTADENEAIETILHEVRMAFVHVSRAAAK